MNKNITKSFTCKTCGEQISFEAIGTVKSWMHLTLDDMYMFSDYEAKHIDHEIEMNS